MENQRKRQKREGGRRERSRKSIVIYPSHCHILPRPDREKGTSEERHEAAADQRSRERGNNRITVDRKKANEEHTYKHTGRQIGRQASRQTVGQAVRYLHKSMSSEPSGSYLICIAECARGSVEHRDRRGRGLGEGEPSTQRWNRTPRAPGPDDKTGPPAITIMSLQKI